MRGGRRGLRAVVAIAATTLLLAGCSSETTPASSSESGGSSATEEPPPPEPIDPCGLLTATDLEAARVSADLERSVRDFATDSRTSACLVPRPEDSPKGGWAAYFGFSLEPDVSPVEAVEQVSTEKPVRLDVGDEARLVRYNAYGDKFWQGWASDGSYSVMVQLFDKPRPAQVERLLGRMLEQGDPVMFDFPIDLPDECPPPRSRPIQKLLGKVATATGSSSSDDLRCSYANRRGLTASLSTTPYKSAAKVSQTIDDVATYFDERSTPARGVTLFVSPGDAYAFSHAYVRRPPSVRSVDLQQTTVIGNYYEPLQYDEQKYRALAVWWATRS
ncbi:MAG: hypothetical protein WBP61_00105 [Nocardioides sp.]